jgi:hypothetical protein
MPDLSPQSGPKRTFDQAALIWRFLSARPTSPDMSCKDSKRARHRQRQAAYEARFATATEASSSWRAIGAVIVTPSGGTAGCVMLRDRRDVPNCVVV